MAVLKKGNVEIVGIVGIERYSHGPSSCRVQMRWSRGTKELHTGAAHPQRDTTIQYHIRNLRQFYLGSMIRPLIDIFSAG